MLSFLAIILQTPIGLLSAWLSSEGDHHQMYLYNYLIRENIGSYMSSIQWLLLSDD